MPLNPGVVKRVVAEFASLSSNPAIANILSAFPVWSEVLYCYSISYIKAFKDNLSYIKINKLIKTFEENL